MRHYSFERARGLIDGEEFEVVSGGRYFGLHGGKRARKMPTCYRDMDRGKVSGYQPVTWGLLKQTFEFSMSLREGIQLDVLEMDVTEMTRPF